MNKLNEILNSEKIHLTFSEKEFVKETVKILKTFFHKTEDVIYKKFNQIVSTSNDKIKNKTEFLDFLYSFRYPISWQKIKVIKKINNKVPLHLEFDEQKFFNKDILQKVEPILNNINE